MTMVLDAMTSLSFIWAQFLWGLLLGPALIAAYVYMQRRRKKYAVRYASLSLVKDAMGRGPGIRRHVPPLLFLIGISLMLVAFARPTAMIKLPSNESVVILTIDISGSMLAEDVSPNRMEAAKAAAMDFVESQPRDVLIGVVSFSDAASIVQAPTRDKEAVKAAITKLTPQRGTAIGRGLLTSVSAIFESFNLAEALRPDELDNPLLPSPSGGGSIDPYESAFVVLLTDGQNTTGPDPLDVINEATDRGLRVYTVGLGSAEGTILRIRNRSVRVFLDEPTLRQIAGATGARYFKADSETDLREIYKDLSTRLVFKREETEITAGFTGLAVISMVLAGALSMLWFNRLP